MISLSILDGSNDLLRVWPSNRGPAAKEGVIILWVQILIIAILSYWLYGMVHRRLVVRDIQLSARLDWEPLPEPEALVTVVCPEGFPHEHE